MVIIVQPLLALALLTSPDIPVPSHFAWAGTVTPISSLQQCNDLLTKLYRRMPRQNESSDRTAALDKAANVMARLCREQKFGQAAMQYQALKGALKAYQGQP